MKRIPLSMVRKDLLDIPIYALPSGFEMKFFQEGDEHIWAEIETSVGEFTDTESALTHFNNEFGPYMDEMSKRCLFIENDHGEKVGTITSWYGKRLGDQGEIGRIHWVGIIPAYQGKKLSKPLLSAALSLLACHHKKAYLTSQTTSFQAVNMYLNYGFEPFITSADCYEAWSLLEDKLNRKIVLPKHK